MILVTTGRLKLLLGFALSYELHRIPHFVKVISYITLSVVTPLMLLLTHMHMWRAQMHAAGHVYMLQDAVFLNVKA